VQVGEDSVVVKRDCSVQSDQKFNEILKGCSRVEMTITPTQRIYGFDEK
jgi:hypothetical protein